MQEKCDHCKNENLSYSNTPTVLYDKTQETFLPSGLNSEDENPKLDTLPVH